MEIGLALPQDGGAAALLERARRAEALGLGSVWVADQPSGAEPVVTLAALARATTRVRLGALALAASRRPPGVLAKALAGIDRLSGGRLVVGMGPGEGEGDTAAVEALAEALHVLRGLLASDGEPFTFAGRHHRVADARCLPGPLQRPHPPLWVVGGDDAVVQVAAGAGDGWAVTGTWTPERFGRRLRVLWEACERGGRDPGSLALAVRLDDWHRGRTAGTVEQVGAELEAWAAAGVDTLVFAGANRDDIEILSGAVP